MIKFVCKNVNVEELKKTVRDALIDCAAEAIGPLYGDYESTGLDYSSCATVKEKRRIFAEDFLGDLEIETIDDGIILYDYLNVEDTENDGSYDLKDFILNIQKVFPGLEVSGAGQIDYGFSMTEYEIYMENNDIKVVYDGYEEDDSEWMETTSSNDITEVESHFSDNLPRMVCDDAMIIDALLDYKQKKAGSIGIDKELSYALEIIEAELVLIYMPINNESLQETKKIGFPLNPQANGVLFVYRSNGNYRTTTDELVAICSVLNGSDNEWACPNPMLHNSLPTFYELAVALNIYLQDKNLYEEYKSMDEYTVLFFDVDKDQLIAKKIVC